MRVINCAEVATSPAGAGGWGKPPEGGDPTAGPAGAGDGSSRLDLKALNGSEPHDGGGDALLIWDCRCRSWCCPSCGPSYWSQVGARIMPHLGMFERARLLTLTVDRKHFRFGWEAYDAIRPKLRTFLRLFEFRKGFAVMAFHPKGPEWPHWHILVDLADCGPRVDLKRMWRIWRDKWGFGGLDLDVKPREESSRAAARYALSYCQHQAGVIPPWVMLGSRTPRAFEAFGELRAALRKNVPETPTGEPSEEPSDSDSEASPKTSEASPKRPSRSVGDRLKDCGKGATVMLRRCFPGGGVSRLFLGRLPTRAIRLVLAEMEGKLPAVNLRHAPRTLSNGAEIVDVTVPLGPHDDPRQIFERIERAAQEIAEKDQQEFGGGAGEVCDVPF